MQAQYERQKGDLIVEIKARMTSATVRDYSPRGAVMDLNFQGEVAGKYNGAHVETVSVLFKPDGTNEAESKSIEFTGQGSLVYVTGKAKGKQVSPTRVEIQSEIQFQTQSSELTWLNSTKGRGEAIFNPETGEINIEIYSSSQSA